MFRIHEFSNVNRPHEVFLVPNRWAKPVTTIPRVARVAPPANHGRGPNPGGGVLSIRMIVIGRGSQRGGGADKAIGPRRGHPRFGRRGLVFSPWDPPAGCAGFWGHSGGYWGWRKRQSRGRLMGRGGTNVNIRFFAPAVMARGTFGPQGGRVLGRGHHGTAKYPRDESWNK